MSLKIVEEKSVNETKLKYIAHRLEFEQNELLDLLPDELRTDFALQCYIGGGSIYSIYNDETAKDYDFFVITSKLAEKIREYFLEQVGYHGKGISGGEYKGYPLLITDNAVSIGKYQIITQWFGLPDEVVSTFDFKHLMFYYRNNKIETLSDFKYLASRKIFYNENRARDIVHSLMRLNKFIKREMSVSQKEVSKMILALDKVGISDRERDNLSHILRMNDDDVHDHAGS
jgi:hypothetical protein